jgi:hypothetical protein
LWGILSLWQAIHRELLGDTILKISANVSVWILSSVTGASSMKKLDEVLSLTSLLSSDDSANKIIRIDPYL